MSFRPTRVAVIGATGPTGIHLTRELVRRGRRVRAVSRRLETLRELFGGEGMEVAAADALDADATARAAAYVPDAIRMVADLAEREEAYGTDWGIPGSGPLTPRRLVEIATEHLGRPVRLRAVPPALARLLAWVHPELRQIRPMVPHYVRPVRYDTSKLRGLLGTVETTPFEEAVPETLDWSAAHGATT